MNHGTRLIPRIALATALGLSTATMLSSVAQAQQGRPGRAAPTRPAVAPTSSGFGRVKGHPLPTTITAQDTRPASANKIPATQQVEFNVKWNLIDFPLKPRLFELAPQASDMLGDTKQTADIRRTLPILQEVADGKVLVPQGGVKFLALVIENATDKPIYFFASPHATEPLTEGWGAKFSCLCNGLNYRVRPRTTWYRVMALRVAPTNQASKFTFIHNLHGIDPRELPAQSDELGD